MPPILKESTKMKVYRLGTLIDIDEKDAKALIEKFPEVYKPFEEEIISEPPTPEPEKKKKGK